MNNDREARKKIHESVHSRYGDNADTLIKFMKSISYSLYWGESIIIDESSNKWKPVHANRKADLHRWAESKGMSRKESLAEGPVIYPTRLSLWRLERHLNHIITSHKGDLLYFQSRPQRSDDWVDVFVMLDIDLHTSDSVKSDAMEFAQRLVSEFGLSAYIESSTNGEGAHLFCWYSFPPQTSNKTIRTSLNRLSSELRSSTSSWGFVSVFDAIKGTPPLFGSDKSVLSTGVLGKFPLPKTQEDAKELTSLRRNPFPLHLLENDKKGGGGKRHNCIGSTHCKSSEKNGQTGDGKDTYERVKDFVLSSRPKNPSWSEAEAWAAYQQAGLQTGNSDQRCFEQMWEFSNRTWDPAKAGKRSIHAQSLDAIEVISNLIENNGMLSSIKADHQKRSRKKSYRVQSLSITMLSQTYALMTNSLRLANGRGTIGKKQIIRGMDDIFGTSMNGSMYKAATRWLRRNQLMKIVAYEIKPLNGTGRARIYRFGASHPETKMKRR